MAASNPSTRTPRVREAAGEAARVHVPRRRHGEWRRPHERRDPLAILERASRGRVPELKPIRYGRMARSPFTFLRGSAALMAFDLARTPVMGVHVQACGDCHLLNFGLFATPERNLVFDVNDFDETHPAPWEWDVKRLLASIVVAARDSGLSDARARDAVLACVGHYRESMAAFARMTPLEVWYQRLDMQKIIDMAPNAEGRKFRRQLAEKARRRVAEHLVPKIAMEADGKHHLIDQPPLLYHVGEPDFAARARAAMAAYRLSLSDDRRVLLDRYHVVDFAMKVVGIGSVGTRCYIALLMSEHDDPLMLQFKEAQRSVLEPYTAKCAYENQGQRVVMGQRLMQSSSDIFLGWVRGQRGHDFYVRQLRDMKMSMPIDGISATRLAEYAKACGHTLARAHAKGGDPSAVSGYLGKGDKFDRAVTRFAFAYADQTERDHATLVRAVKAGRVEVLEED
ncbi:MAG: DUF2252 domain-containing protein [Burkholderiales bacterium]